MIQKLLRQETVSIDAEVFETLLRLNEIARAKDSGTDRERAMFVWARIQAAETARTRVLPGI
jgi:hypothetical protein